jgi:DNA polymerase III epsilon subunit family exonuclease
MPLSDVPVVVVDLEMTGLDPDKDRICEVGLVRARGERIEETFQSLVTPGVPMSVGARAVHRIPDEALADAPSFADVAPDVARVLDGAIVVAHHVQFDLAFLLPALSRVGLNIEAYPRVDTLAIARQMFAFRSHRLSAVCSSLAIDDPVSHRALDDAKATFAVFRRIVALLDPEGVLSVGAFLALVEQLAPQSSLRRTQAGMIQVSMESKRSVWFDYLSPTTSDGYIRTRREVDVWAVKPPRVHGFCHLRNAERVFRIERIYAVEMGERTFEVPEFRSKI